MISVSGDRRLSERAREKKRETQVLFKKSHRSILMKINKKSRGVKKKKEKGKRRETKGDTSAALSSCFVLRQINSAPHTH